MSAYYHERPVLAQSLVNDLTGVNLFSDAPDGLFLAAPRRTGKSKFLMNDLAPALEKAGYVVVYVDLWSDTTRNPGVLIADAIGAELGKHLGIVARTAKASGLDHVNLAGWAKIDTTKIGKVDGLTLTEALKALTEASKKPVALIVDEAQHSLTSDEGEAAMTALKSARDQLNKAGKRRLLIVMSGSDRDKLLRLVNTNAAPFFGSAISRMPELDKNFVAGVASRIEQAYPQLKPVDVDQLMEAFERLGHRPQPFMRILGEELNPVDLPAPGFEPNVVAAADRARLNGERQMESTFLALRPLEKAILWRIFEQKGAFRPYDAEALKFYKEKTGKKVTAQQAQAAIESLRAQTPSLIWKSAKGEYALDDASMLKWYEKRLQAGTWPPQDPDLFDVGDDTAESTDAPSA